jgi:hypothetical protein
MLIAVTRLCLTVLVAQLLGASVPSLLFLLASAWLILIGIGCAIYILGYAIYILSKVHDIYRAQVGAISQKKLSIQKEEITD